MTLNWKGVLFTLNTLAIFCGEYFKYLVCWNKYNRMIMNIAERLAASNMFYIKMFQAFATNNTVMNKELTEFFLDYTDNVPYTDDEFDVAELQAMETVDVDGDNSTHLVFTSFKPIRSGMMSIIFEGRIGDTDVVVKYLRKNIHGRFNDAIDMLSQFLILSKHIPVLRHMNLDKILNENRKSIQEQIDFEHEVHNIKLFKEKWEGCRYVKIPDVYEIYTKTNKNVIVLERIYGKRVRELQPEEKDAYANALARFIVKSIFYDRLYHADLHQGNLFFLNTPLIDDDAEDEDEKEEALAQSQTQTQSQSQTQFIPVAVCESEPMIDNITTPRTIEEQQKQRTICTIGLIDYGIVNVMTKLEQRYMYEFFKLVFRRKTQKTAELIIDYLADYTTQTEETNKRYEEYLLAHKTGEMFKTRVIKDADVRLEIVYQLKAVIDDTVRVDETKPQVCGVGPKELYSINKILHAHGLGFNGTLYKCILAIAVADGLSKELSYKTTYIEQMMDAFAEMFELNDADDDSDEEDSEDEGGDGDGDEGDDVCDDEGDDVCDDEGDDGEDEGDQGDHNKQCDADELSEFKK